MIYCLLFSTNAIMNQYPRENAYVNSLPTTVSNTVHFNEIKQNPYERMRPLTTSFYPPTPLSQNLQQNDGNPHHVADPLSCPKSTWFHTLPGERLEIKPSKCTYTLPRNITKIQQRSGIQTLPRKIQAECIRCGQRIQPRNQPAARQQTSGMNTLPQTSGMNTLPTRLPTKQRRTILAQPADHPSDRPAGDQPPVATDQPPVATDQPPVATDQPPVAAKRQKKRNERFEPEMGKVDPLHLLCNFCS